MLIQCHSCNTKYRLNLEQIPRRKTFVRCKSCGTPIYIDPTEEEAPTARVIPPPAGAVAPQDGDGAFGVEAPLTRGPPASPPPAPGQPATDGLVLVVCPSCSARYRVASAPLQRAGVKLKCTQCGHLFAAPPHLQPMPPTLHEGYRGESEPAESSHMESPRSGRQPTPEMPLPDEQRVERMFDDLRPGPMEQRVDIRPPPGPAYPRDTDLGSLPDARFEDEPPAPDAESAYLDAVAFDGQTEERPPKPGLPDDQKYRFFLDPKTYQGGEFAGAGAPGAHVAPPLPGQEAAGGGTDADAPDTSAEPPDELPPLPVKPTVQTHDEMAQVREVVAGQQARFLSERRTLGLLAAAAVTILLATGAWGYWLARTASDERPFSVQREQPHQLVLEDDLRGRYVTNQASGKRLFVVNGQVENRFGPGEQVRWIRIKGTAYADAAQQRPLDTSFAYAGNVLADDQLSQWELVAIKAYYGFTNGRDAQNVSIPPGVSVPYQLVFSEVPEQVLSTVAQIVSYQLNERAVFVDAP